MNSKIIIEAVGYLGSFLVLVSFLMVSVVKLRIVNTIGSLIFMIYALIIRSYPTAVMNFCLVLINLHFLYRMSRPDTKVYDLVRVREDDTFLEYFIRAHQEDIMKYFPDTDFSFEGMDRSYIILHEGKPVGVTLGIEKDGEMELLLDYSIPEYRDFSVGQYLLPRLAEEGITKLIFGKDPKHHTEYLNKLGYQKENGRYVKKL